MKGRLADLELVILKVSDRYLEQSCSITAGKRQSESGSALMLGGTM
jgi:hypothetical protein